MKQIARLVAASLIVVTLSCGTDAVPYRSTGTQVLSPVVQTVDVEVDYEAGAKPYLRGDFLGGDIWSIFRKNVAALLEPTSPDLGIDSTGEEMTELGELSGDAYSPGDILDIADTHQTELSSQRRANFYIIFLDAYYEAGGEPRKRVLGVSLSFTRVMAIFKPVIENTGNPQRAEQTTLVHEFGHAIGLVENGIRAVSEHHDAEHGAHCVNRACVMYHLNENPLQISHFVREVVTGKDQVLFGKDCLADVRRAAHRQQ